MKDANLFVCFCLLLFVSCNEDKIPLPVQELVTERMKLFKLAQDSICRSVAIKKAEIAVDSFFLTLQKQYLLDSIHVPLKPIKPSIDTQLILDKTLPIKPLWDSLSLKIK